METFIDILDHVPKTYMSLVATIAAITLFVVIFRTERRELQYSRTSVSDILGNSKAVAPEWCRERWSVTKDNRFLVNGRRKEPPFEKIKSYLDQAVAEKLHELDPTREVLEGVTLDTSWITGLWDEGHLTLEHLLRSFCAEWGTEIKGLSFADRPLMVLMVSRPASTPVQFRTRVLMPLEGLKPIPFQANASPCQTLPA